MGRVATSPLPPWACQPLRSGGQNHRCPTSGPARYVTPAAWGVPTASRQGAESEVAHKWARWLHNACRLAGPDRLEAGGTIRSGPQTARWLHNPCRLGGPRRLRAGGRIRGRPQVGGWLHNLCHAGGPHRFRAGGGGGGQRWPTSGPVGYITPAAWGVPTASERGAESEVARTWGGWLHNPCRLGGPQHFRAGDRIRGGPQVGRVATQPLPPGDPHRFTTGGQNQKWPTSGPGGYITLAGWRCQTASQRGSESEVAHKWAGWRHNPCRPGGPHRFTEGGKIRGGPQVRRVAPQPLPPRGSPPLQLHSGGGGGADSKVPHSLGGYITPTAWGVPTASVRGAESKGAHKWAGWLHNPCRLGGSPPLGSGG